MKKIISLAIICSCMPVSAAFAADLPAELEFESMGFASGGFSYITQDNQIGVVREVVYDADLTGLYCNDVLSLGIGYGVEYEGKETELFIKNDGTLWCYSADDGEASSVQIDNIENCIKAGSGASGVIALTSEGEVYMWGRQDGENKLSDVGAPIEKVEGLTDIVDIATGWRFAYALDSEGYVYKWGYLKNGEKIRVKRLPEIENCVEIDQGSCLLLARTIDGSVYRFADAPYNVKGRFSKYQYEYPENIYDIENCTHISGSSMRNEGLMLTANNELKFYNKKYLLKTYSITEGEADRIVSGYYDHVIMKDGSVWMVKYDLDNNGCSLEYISNIENCISSKSIRFVKRSEMAEKLIEAYEVITGKQCETAVSSSYTDVSSDSEYKEVIEQCRILGLMDGTDEDGSFSPNKVLRREQAAVILDRLFDISKKEIPAEYRTEKYEDDEDISDWARESVYRTAGLFDRENKFDPQEYVTYDELHEIMQKIIK